MAKVVTVEFQNVSKKYSFFTDFENLENGDVLVVHSRGILQLAEFVEYVEHKDHPMTDKWVMDVVDTAIYKEHLKKEQKERELFIKIERLTNAYNSIPKSHLIGMFDQEMSGYLNELEDLKGKDEEDSFDSKIRGVQLQSKFG